jgi:hypothetical protein
MLPVNIFFDTLEKIREMADEQRLITVDSIKRKLIEIQTDYDEGKINESEYQRAIEFLSDRLEAIKRSEGERRR